MESFFEVKRPDEVFEIIDRLISPTGEETVPLSAAVDRVMARDMKAPEDLPGFFRSTMDGYAVRAKGTFGATEGLPALFQVVGEVRMGRPPDMVVKEGQAVKIPTGGMLPQGADSVLMKEYCHCLDEETIEATRAASPLENVIGPADDFRRGAVFLTKGHRLRPQDVGVLAGFGITEIPVFKKPRIAIISTGDEIVPVDHTPLPGQVRDINQYTLGALCQRAGAEPVFLGLCPDKFEPLKGIVEEALARSDSVWISGGSSVGTRDLTLRVFESLADFELLVHGISISPGKPTIIGRAGSRPVVGLPGHVASALVVAEVFMTRMISLLSGYAGRPRRWGTVVEAELSRNIPSANGREDYVRVMLSEGENGLTAVPVFGKSGLISTLVDADGLVRIDMNAEGLYQGQRVKVILFEHTEGGLL